MDFKDDFSHLTALLNDANCVDIQTWKKVDDFKKLADQEKRKCNFVGQSGLYAIHDVKGDVLYIGKAKCIHNRLSSHSKALVGGDRLKAPAWDQFFRYCNEEDLEARYFVVEGFSTDRISEMARQAIERALQIKYKPLFDEIYPGRKIVLDDFDNRVVGVRKMRE